MKDMKIREYGLLQSNKFYIIAHSCMFKTDAVRYTKTQTIVSDNF